MKIYETYNITVRTLKPKTFFVHFRFGDFRMMPIQCTRFSIFTYYAKAKILGSCYFPPKCTKKPGIHGSFFFTVKKT